LRWFPLPGDILAELRGTERRVPWGPFGAVSPGASR
jgi:hypothetical protein